MKNLKRISLFTSLFFGIIFAILLIGLLEFFLATKKYAIKKELSPFVSKQHIISVAPSFSPTKASLSYHDKTLGISFNYPGNLGLTHTLDDSRENQNWHRIDFDKGGFEAGYFEISASTTNYQPIAGEGSPHFFDEKVLATNSTDSVKSSLEKANFIPVTVEKVQSTNGISAFRTYVTFCYGPCQLERLYIIPISNSKFSNILILTVIGIMYAVPTTNDPLPIDQTKQFAKQDSIQIDNGTASEKVLHIAQQQDMIFNSLVFDK